MNFTNSQLDVALSIIDNATYDNVVYAPTIDNVELNAINYALKRFMNLTFDAIDFHELCYRCASLNDAIDNFDEFTQIEINALVKKIIDALVTLQRLDK